MKILEQSSANAQTTHLELENKHHNTLINVIRISPGVSTPIVRIDSNLGSIACSSKNNFSQNVMKK